MPDPQTLLLSVVTRLLDDPAIPARLLALGDAAAVLAMADGSLAALFTPAFGSADALGAKLRALVEDNPGAHLKLVVIGGDPAIRELLPKQGASVLARRAVQLFHLFHDRAASDGPAWALWTGGGGRPDSPLGMTLAAAGRGELPPPAERAALLQRVDRPPPLSSEERARLAEGQAFIAALRVRPRATWGLVAVLGVVFVLETLWGGSETVPTLVRMGGNTDASLASEPWRLLSSALLHGGLLHLGLNGSALLMLGGFLERVLGVARYAVLLGAAAVGGSLASALMPPLQLSVGASGAICGVLGAAAALSWRPGQVIPAIVVGPLRRNAMVNLALVVTMSLLPQVDAWAHLGGGLVGAALVLSGVLTRGLARPGSGPSADGRGLSIAAGTMAGLTVACLAAAWITGRPWVLVAEPTWARHALGEVSIEAPTLLRAPLEIPLERGGMQWVVGDPMRDPLVLVVEVQPHGLDREQLAAEIRALEGDEGAPELPEGARVATPWHRVAGDGPPTFEAQYVLEDGLHDGYSLQLRDDVLVKLSSERWPELAARWAEPARRIHASLAEGAR